MKRVVIYVLVFLLSISLIRYYISGFNLDTPTLKLSTFIQELSSLNFDFRMVKANIDVINSSFDIFLSSASNCNDFGLGIISFISTFTTPFFIPISILADLATMLFQVVGFFFNLIFVF